MTRGQLEVSFQWVFALIAGVAFLVVFFFAFRACSTAGQERVSGMGAKAAVTAISGMAWQVTNTSAEFPDLDVMCVGGGEITLGTKQSGDVNAIGVALDRVPAFLSPNLKGRNQIVTREVSIDASPRISLGTVLYDMSESTLYLIINSTDATAPLEVLNIKNSRTTVKVLQSATQASSYTVPASFENVIVVSFTGQPPCPADLGAKTTCLGVQITSTSAKFYVDGAYKGESQLSGAQLKAGALVSGRKETFECGKRNFVARARTLVWVWNERATRLKAQYAPTSVCGMEFRNANTLLPANYVNARDDDLLKNIFTTNSQLVDSQRKLYEGGCAVIA